MRSQVKKHLHVTVMDGKTVVLDATTNTTLVDIGRNGNPIRTVLTIDLESRPSHVKVTTAYDGLVKMDGAELMAQVPVLETGVFYDRPAKATIEVLGKRLTIDAFWV